jgi:prepilin-type N-terminal cleavage/methylation domain-containing protein
MNRKRTQQMIQYQRLNHHGFTIVEVMMTVFIFVAVAGACYFSLNSGMRNWKVNNARLELQQELRKAMDWMTEDLRHSGTSSSVMNVPADDAWYTSATFRRATGVSGGSIVWSTDTYQYVLGGTGNTTLQRIVGANTQVVATNVQSLQIRRLSVSPEIVEVRMRVRRPTIGGGFMEANNNFKVKLRNG